MRGGVESVAVQLPAVLAHGHYTVEDWLDLPETAGQRIELIDGCFVVSPAPLSAAHRICVGRLCGLLNEAAPEDLEAVEAVGVRTEYEVAVPDAVVANLDALIRDTAVLLPGQVHLATETVCGHHPNGPDKFRIYAAAGVPTFLRIDLAGTDAPYIEALSLRNGAYTLVAKASAGQTLELTEPFPVAFDPACLVGYRSQ